MNFSHDNFWQLWEWVERLSLSQEAPKYDFIQAYNHPTWNTIAYLNSISKRWTNMQEASG